jgi:hypothetical protein
MATKVAGVAVNEKRVADFLRRCERVGLTVRRGRKHVHVVSEGRVVCGMQVGKNSDWRLIPNALTTLKQNGVDLEALEAERSCGREDRLARARAEEERLHARALQRIELHREEHEVATDQGPVGGAVMTPHQRWEGDPPTHEQVHARVLEVEREHDGKRPRREVMRMVAEELNEVWAGEWTDSRVSSQFYRVERELNGGATTRAKGRAAADKPLAERLRLMATHHRELADEFERMAEAAEKSTEALRAVREAFGAAGLD